MPRHDTSGSTAAGVTYGLAAFLWWGACVIYYRELQWVDTLEIVCHRTVWSALILIGLLVVRGRLSEWGLALRDRRTLGLLAASTALLGVSWYVYIWALTHARIAETSLAYFINPLVNVVLGYLLLKERLSPAQVISVTLAAVGVIILWLFNGSLPVISLFLAADFALYGLLRKKMRIDAVGGLAIEMIVLTLLAIPAMFYLDGHQRLVFAHQSRGIDALLAFAGIATALPLIWFIKAARRLRYASLGVMMYLMPTMTLLLAVCVYGEPFGPVQLVGFSCIWAGLIVYSIDSLRRPRNSIQLTMAASVMPVSSDVSAPVGAARNDRAGINGA